MSSSPYLSPDYGDLESGTLRRTTNTHVTSMYVAPANGITAGGGHASAAPPTMPMSILPRVRTQYRTDAASGYSTMTYNTTAPLASGGVSSYPASSFPLAPRRRVSFALQEHDERVREHHSSIFRRLKAYLRPGKRRIGVAIVVGLFIVIVMIRMILNGRINNTQLDDPSLISVDRDGSTLPTGSEKKGSTAPDSGIDDPPPLVQDEPPPSESTPPSSSLPPTSTTLPHLPLTIFTTLRDFTRASQLTSPGEYLRHWNALKSWRRLGIASSNESPISILLFVDHPTETCAHLRDDKRYDMTHVRCELTPCFSEEFKKPFMDCIWRDALELAKTDYLTFVNSDIILLDDFYHAFLYSAAKLPRFVLVAQRIDVPSMDWPREKLTYFMNAAPPQQGEIPQEPDLDEEGRPHSTLVYEYPYADTTWLTAWQSHIVRYGTIHDDYGVDMFTFHRSILERISFPRFLVGVFRWDNWLLSEMITKANEGRMEHGKQVTLPDIDDEATDSSSSPYLVLDGSSLFHIIHDRVRSDHMHDLGATWNEDRAREASGMRYRIGRIGNSDVNVVWNGAEEDEDGKELTARYCTSSSTCKLEWSSTSDRLDILLSRSANTFPSNTIGLLNINSSYLPLLKSMKDDWKRNMIVVAEDMKSFQIVESEMKGVPVVMTQNLTTSSSSSTSSSSAAVTLRSNLRAILQYRHFLMSRILDYGFSLFLFDLSSLLTEVDSASDEPPSLSHITNELARVQDDEGGEEYTNCTIIARQKELHMNSKKEDENTDESDDSSSTSTASMYTTSFMLLHANKYSRFFLHQLGVCETNILSGAYSAVVDTHLRRRPTSYIEDRCLHDIVQNMRDELSKETQEDFKTCEIRKEEEEEHHEQEGL